MRKELLLQSGTILGYALADCNGPDPISIPYTDVVLSNNKALRGILATVGTPPQNISFRLNTHANDTLLWNSTNPSCPDDTTRVQCQSMRGGDFDTENSNTFHPVINVAASGGSRPDDARGFDATGGATDVLTIGNASLEEFPFRMTATDETNWNRQANLGFGHNSTLLNRLKSSGRIGSRSWSFWFGIDNAESRSAIDGQLVLGGYDAAKITGQAYTQPLQNTSIECGSGMTLPFTSMTLNFPNGSTADISPGAVITACIWLDRPWVMLAPENPYLEDFESKTDTQYVNKSLGINWWSYVYPSTNVFQGELELQIQNGPAIKIPNDALIVPERAVNASGSVQTNNSAAVSLFTADPDDSSSSPNLAVGMNFFSAAYLSVDYDKHTWTMWSANATTDTRLVKIGGDECKQPGASIDDNAATSGPNESRSALLTTGTVAGIVVGAVAALVIAVGTGRWIIVRRKAKRNAGFGNKIAAIGSDHGMRSGDIQSAAAGRQYMPEMRGDMTLPAELLARRDPSELPYDHTKASELPHDRSKIAHAELAQHNSRHYSRTQNLKDACELSSSPAIRS